MPRRLRLPLALACLVLAALLHVAFCEWRTLEYAAADDAAVDERLLLSLRKELQPGNAERWDREDRSLRIYDAAWLACYRDARGRPEPGDARARCLAARRYRVLGSTAEAVALAECEGELHGRVVAAEVIAACLRARGYAEAPLPRWSFERIGRRFDGPYVTQTGLFAEGRAADSRTSLWLAAGLGLGGPAIFVALGLALGIDSPAEAPAPGPW